MMTNANKSDVEYQLSLKQRREDAKTRMKQTAKLLNGEMRTAISSEIVGAAANAKPRNKRV